MAVPNGENVMVNKRICGIVLAIVVAVSLISCGNGKSKGGDGTAEERVLTIYTPAREELINLVIKGFEEETGIKTEIIAAGMGELMKRLEAEKENPLADVIWGGSPSLLIPKRELLADYVSPNEVTQLEGHNNDEGYLTRFNSTPSVLIINTNLIGNINIEGYADLLNPALKGKIVHSDPASSGSAYNHVINMLYAMGKNGDPDSPEAWDYVAKFIENLNGKVAGSSSSAYKGVADGEYVVGLTYEGPVIDLIAEGAPVKVIYMKEGVIFKDAAAAVVKNSKHPENAKRFIDYCILVDVQNKMGTDLGVRPVAKGAGVSSLMTPIEEINTIKEDIMWPVDNKNKVVERYSDLFATIQSKK